MKIEPFADLSGADLSGAYLYKADLCGASLRGADLSGAYLCGADLRGADLSGVYLSGVYLCGADLRGADLRGADLSGANLSGANIEGAILPDTIVKLPPKGEGFTAYKKTNEGRILKIYVPPHADRTGCLTSNKCRCSEAIVLEGSGRSWYNKSIGYEQGQTIRPDKYDDDIRVACTNGIHFFMTEEEAQKF